MTHLGTIPIATAHLVLRRFIWEDKEAVYRNCWCEQDVWKWTNYAPMPTIEDVSVAAHMFTDAWFGAYERADRYSWAIEERASGQVIGRLFGMHPDDRLSQVELAYEIGSAWWNRGYMTEAVQAILDFYFQQVGFNRVYAYHAHANPASGRVMQKCGMVYEGTQRQACICNAGIFDRVNYGILASDHLKMERTAHKTL